MGVLPGSPRRGPRFSCGSPDGPPRGARRARDRAPGITEYVTPRLLGCAPRRLDDREAGAEPGGGRACGTQARPVVAKLGRRCELPAETPCRPLRVPIGAVYCEPLSFPAPGMAFTSPGAIFSPEEVTP